MAQGVQKSYGGDIMTTKELKDKLFKEYVPIVPFGCGTKKTKNTKTPI